MIKDKKLDWHVEERDLKDLYHWDKNPRKISDKSRKNLKEKIIKRGLHDVLVIDTDGTVISGNQRAKILKELNIKKIKVLVPNRKLTEEERNAIGIESNIVDGEWDMAKLKSFEIELLSDVGFKDFDLTDIWQLESKNDEFNVEEELKKIKIPETEKGDLIILGDHKLLCSDSTDPEAVKKLFGDDKTSFIYSDSPYNINLSYNSGVGNKSNYGGDVDDNKSPDEYKEFLRKIIVNSLSVANEDCHVFMWADEAWVWVFQTLYNELGITNRRLNIWCKNNSSPTPSVAFNKAIEICVYGTKNKPYLSKSIKNLNEIMNKELGTGNELLEQVNNIWAYKRLPSKDYEHPTTKPPELHEKAIKRCTKLGDIIFDAFCGSGSTMICAEQLKRRVYSIEISEIFCDLTIRRWEHLTGKKAKVIRNYYEKV